MATVACDRPVTKQRPVLTNRQLEIRLQEAWETIGTLMEQIETLTDRLEAVEGDTDILADRGYFG